MDLKQTLNEVVREVQQKRYDNESAAGKAFIKNAGKFKLCAATWTGYCLGTGFIPAAAMGAVLTAGFWGIERLTKDVQK